MSAAELYALPNCTFEVSRWGYVNGKKDEDRHVYVQKVCSNCGRMVHFFPRKGSDVEKMIVNDYADKYDPDLKDVPCGFAAITPRILTPQL